MVRIVDVIEHGVEQRLEKLDEFRRHLPLIPPVQLVQILREPPDPSLQGDGDHLIDHSVCEVCFKAAVDRGDDADGYWMCPTELSLQPCRVVRSEAV
ncbi:hypothetical protein [Naasia lichenicola]|uniref:Uncharacterized protein n=1 Tax=Naasia lichenicola TaxID=2565933 RepID=A0A4S4FKJ2_9MICO|nr:hypothetical protein [Naasia lichenicola]THG30953.1 hypothetical protein E6C64_10090 [Naasia lichenicola]